MLRAHACADHAFSSTSLAIINRRVRPLTSIDSLKSLNAGERETKRKGDVISYFSKLLAKWGETIFYGSIIGFNVDQLREADNILCDTQTKPAGSALPTVAKDSPTLIVNIVSAS